MNKLFPDVCKVFRVWPVRVHVLDGLVNAIWVERVVEPVDVLPDLLIKELFVDFEIRQQAFVVVCGVFNDKLYGRAIGK